MIGRAHTNGAPALNFTVYLLFSESFLNPLNTFAFMISIYRRTTKDKEVTRVKKAFPGCWVKVTDPTKEELEKLSNGFKLDHKFLIDSLDSSELPRIEIEEGVVYVLIQIPYQNGGSLSTIPLSIIIHREVIITVCKKETDVLHDFINKKMRFYTTQKSNLLIQIFLKVSNLYDKHIKEISKHIKSKKVNLRKLTNNDIVSLVETEEILNEFNTSILPTSNIFQKIMAGKVVPLYRDDKNLIEDLLINMKQTTDVCRTNARSITIIREAYSAVMSNDLNKVIKFLTAFTIILTIPTIIASIYGMNIGLPLDKSPIAFVYVMGIMLLIAVLLILFFLKKKWL